MWKKFIVGYDNLDDDNKTVVAKTAWFNVLFISVIKKEIDTDYTEDEEGNEIATEVEKLRIRIQNENHYLYEITEDELIKLVQNIPKNLPLIQGEKYVG